MPLLTLFCVCYLAIVLARFPNPMSGKGGKSGKSKGGKGKAKGGKKTPVSRSARAGLQVRLQQHHSLRSVSRAHL